MNSTFTEELKTNIADEDTMFVKTFTDSGFKVSVETIGLSIFGTKAGKELFFTLVKNLLKICNTICRKKYKEHS